jgi:hypothetical protein
MCRSRQWVKNEIAFSVAMDRQITADHENNARNQKGVIVSGNSQGFDNVVQVEEVMINDTFNKIKEAPAEEQ